MAEPSPEPDSLHRGLPPRLWVPGLIVIMAVVVVVATLPGR